MGSRLVLVEGLPGSGKSTTAELVNQILYDRRHDSAFYCEGNLDHPADYDGVAYFSAPQFESLLETFPSDRDFIMGMAEETEEGIFIAYKKAKEKHGGAFSQALYGTIFRNDIYEIPFDLHIPLLVNRWRRFADKAVTEDKVYVFDCPFIQNPVTIGLIRDNAEPGKVIDFVLQLEHAIGRLHPILIYVNQKDIAYSFTKAARVRPEEWFEGFIKYYTEQGYGKAQGHQGLQGTIDVLLRRKSLEEEILKRLSLRTFVLDNSDFNIEKLRTSLEEILTDGL